MEDIAPATLDSLAKRVKWARQQRRMTQVALAETASVAQSDVSKIERGDSMHNPDERPSYSDGDIIFVDPDLNVAHKDRAIVRLEDDQQVTFKQYMEEGARRYLKALNPDWKPRYIEIDSNATFCGKVIGKWVPD